MFGVAGDSAAAPPQPPPNLKTNLTFPIGKTATLLKDRTSSSSKSPQFTDQAAVYLTASLEYLAAEFSELSGIEAVKEHSKIVNPRHVYSAVRKDEELSELLHKLKIEIGSNEEEEEEVNGEDGEYDYNSDEEDDVDEIPSDVVQEYYDTDTETEDDCVDDQECAAAGGDVVEEYDDTDSDTLTDTDKEEDVINASGQMSIAPDKISKIIGEEYDDTDSDTFTDTDEEDATNTSEHGFVVVGQMSIAPDKVSSDTVEESADDATDTTGNQECESVVLGQMSIALGHVELYKRLIDKFGEIVAPNLPKYKVTPTCAALSGLLDLVETMVEITPEKISQELISDWEGMMSFYSEIGLKLGWLENRVRRYSDWFLKRSGVDVNQLRGRVAAKEEELKEKQKEVSALETELQELSAELETAYVSQSHFGFSFFDE